MFCLPVRYVNTNVLNTEKQKGVLAETKKIPARALEGSLTTAVVLSFWLKGSKSLEKHHNRMSKSVLVLAASARNLDTRCCKQGALLQPMDGWSFFSLGHGQMLLLPPGCPATWSFVSILLWDIKILH